MEPPLSKEVLAQYEDVKLKGVGGGRLILTSRSLKFEKISGLFSKKLTVERHIDLSKIEAVRSEGSRLILEWKKDDLSKTSDEFNFGVEPLCARASNSIGGAVLELKQRLEREEKKKRELAQYRDFIWNTVSILWSTVGDLYEIISWLKDQDWDSIDAKIDDVKVNLNSLSKGRVVNIGHQLDEFLQSISNRNGRVVQQKIFEIVRSIGEGLKGRIPLSLSFEEDLSKEMPSWQHMRYFFLFAARYNEALLSTNLGKVDQIKNSVSRLAELSVILRETFDLDVVARLAELEKEEEYSPAFVSSRLQAIGQIMESYLREKSSKTSEPSEPE